MGYTTNDRMIRVDFFKPSGKYYTTEAIEWLPTDEDKSYPVDIFKYSLREHLQGRLKDMVAVCLETEFCAGFPLMITEWELGR